MPTDDEKAAWSMSDGNSPNNREWHIEYYDCWHCKTCDRELEYICAVCGKNPCDNEFGMWCDIDGDGPYQICWNGCKDVGGLDEFAKICRNQEKI